MAPIYGFRFSFSAQCFQNCFVLTAAPVVSNNVQKHLKMMPGVKIFCSNKMRSFIKMIAVTKKNEVPKN